MRSRAPCTSGPRRFRFSTLSRRWRHLHGTRCRAAPCFAADSAMRAHHDNAPVNHHRRRPPADLLGQRAMIIDRPVCLLAKAGWTSHGFDPCTTKGGHVVIPTEPVGSLPRPAKLQAAYADYDAGKITHEELTREQDAACRDSIKRMEATGSPIVSDGEQRASSFATYPADRHAGRDRPCRQPRRRRPVLRDLHRRPSPATAAADRRAVPIQDLCRRLSREGDEDGDEAAEAGSDRAIDAGAALSARRRGHGLLARAVPLRSLRRVREGHPQAFAAGAARVSIDFTEGRLACRNDPRNPWTGRGMLRAVHRAQQPGARPVLGRGAQEHRHPHLPRRRLRLDAQRRRRLRRPAAQHVQDERRLLPDPARQRAGQGARLQADRRVQPEMPTACRRSASSA